MEDGLREIVAEKGGAGRAVDVDRGMLIDEVVVSPVAGGWMRRLVESVLDTHEMDDVIVSDSKLGGDPYSSDEV